MSNAANVDRALVSFVRKALLPRVQTDFPTLSDKEWHTLTVRADALEVLPLLREGIRLAKIAPPKEIGDAFKTLAREEERERRACEKDIALCLASVSESHASAAVLGDPARAALFEKPALRTVRRFSILTESRALRSLTALDLRTVRTVMCEIPLPEADPKDMGAIRLRSLLARLLDNKAEGSCGGDVTFPVPRRGVEELLLLLDAKKEMSLSLVIDWIAFTEQGEDDRSPAAVRAAWQACGLAASADALTLRAAALLGRPLPETETEDEKDTDLLLLPLLEPSAEAKKEAEARLKAAFKKNDAKKAPAKKAPQKKQSAPVAEEKKIVERAPVSPSPITKDKEKTTAIKKPVQKSGQAQSKAPRTSNTKTHAKKSKPQGTFARLLDGLFTSDGKKRKK